jgi:hypothetical protein
MLVTAATAQTQPHHRLGSRIVVELTGVITSRVSRTGHFAIQPDDSRSSSMSNQSIFSRKMTAPMTATQSG